MGRRYVVLETSKDQDEAVSVGSALEDQSPKNLRLRLCFVCMLQLNGRLMDFVGQEMLCCTVRSDVEQQCRGRLSIYRVQEKDSRVEPTSRCR